MITLKKITALIIAGMLLLLSGCRSNTDGTSSSLLTDSTSVSASKRDYLTLLYSASDTFDPYTAATESNRQLCKLIYEPLIKLDNKFNVIYSIAERAELNGKQCIVTLKSILFSDGSALTADDVVYSFNLAKKSTTEYAYKLYSAESASASDSRTVVFKLTKADPYFINLLDFPILKSGSEKQTTSDSVSLPPTGCGRYKVDETLTKLVLNDKSISNSSNYSIKEIRLINAPDSESLSHYVEIGAADMYYSDISDGNILRMSGKKVNININHIVYIGVNQSYGALAQNELRQAISAGIDRNAVCKDGYYNNAIAATGFFNPLWEPVKSVQNIETAANQEITIENLEKIGYNKVDDRGIRKNNSSYLQFNMLVNSENRTRVAAAQLIARQLSACGIKINVVEKSYADCIAALSSGNFQLYLGEVALTPNMDLSCLVTEGGSAAYGIKKQEADTFVPPTATEQNLTEGGADTENGQDVAEVSATAAEIIEGLYNGQNTISDVASILQTEMPFIPVCYRTGVLFYNDNIENVNNSSVSDIYFSIESYKYNNK